MSDGGETDAYVESQAAGECDSMDRSELLAKFAQKTDSWFGKIKKTAQQAVVFTSLLSYTGEEVAHKYTPEQPSAEIHQESMLTDLNPTEQFAVPTTYVEAIHPALKVAEGLPEPDPDIPEKEDSEISPKKKKKEED